MVIIKWKLATVITLFIIILIYTPIDLVSNINAVTTQSKYSLIIDIKSSEYDYDPNLINAIISIESNYNLSTVGAAGEIGLMQIKPSTAKYVCKEYGIEYHDGMLYDPIVNITIGLNYLSLLEDNLGSLNAAIISYNMGITRYKKNKVFNSVYSIKVNKLKNKLLKGGS